MQRHGGVEPPGRSIESKIIAAGPVDEEQNVVAAVHIPGCRLYGGRSGRGGAHRRRWLGDVHGGRARLHRSAIGQRHGIAGFPAAVAGYYFNGVGAFSQGEIGADPFLPHIESEIADFLPVQVEVDILLALHVAHICAQVHGSDLHLAAVNRFYYAHGGRKLPRFVPDLHVSGVCSEVVARRDADAIEAFAEVEFGSEVAAAIVEAEVGAGAFHQYLNGVPAGHVAHTGAQAEARLGNCSGPALRIGDRDARRIAHRRRGRRHHHVFQDDDHIGLCAACPVAGGDLHVVAARAQGKIEDELLAAEAERGIAAIYHAGYICCAAHVADAGAHCGILVAGVMRSRHWLNNVNNRGQHGRSFRRAEAELYAQTGVVIQVFVGRSPLVPVQLVGARKSDPVSGVQAQCRREVKTQLYAHRGHEAEFGQSVKPVGIGFISTVEDAAAQVAEDGVYRAVVAQPGIRGVVCIAEGVGLVYFSMEGVEADTAVEGGDDAGFAAYFLEGENRFYTQLSVGGAVVLIHKTARHVELGGVVEIIEVAGTVERPVVLYLDRAEGVQPEGAGVEQASAQVHRKWGVRAGQHGAA